MAEVRAAALLLLIVACTTHRVTQADIRFPAGWHEVTPNSEFTLRKAVAPVGYAAIAVMRRAALWDGDEDSSRYADAWDALRGVSQLVFERRFERNDLTGNETPSILQVRKAELGSERAIYVDYELSDREKNVTVRIHSYLILHDHQWYVVSMATRGSEPDLYRTQMEESAKTFRLRDA